MDLIVHVDDLLAAQVRKFLDAAPDRERGGFLLGSWPDEGRCTVHLSDFVPCPHAPSSAASLTFRPEEWQLVHTHPDVASGSLEIVGWVHSHPGMAVGLSEWDIFIHEHFFSGRGQVAWVRDPVSDKEAFWCLRDGRPVRVLRSAS
jgi:proteasome lid subunit RPN8/RPN11